MLAISETFRRAAEVLDERRRYGICFALNDAADHEGAYDSAAHAFLDRAMRDCGFSVWAYHDHQYLEENREARILACLWLALEAEEDGL